MGRDPFELVEGDNLVIEIAARALVRIENPFDDQRTIRRDIIPDFRMLLLESIIKSKKSADNSLLLLVPEKREITSFSDKEPQGIDNQGLSGTRLSKKTGVPLFKVKRRILYDGKICYMKFFDHSFSSVMLFMTLSTSIWVFSSKSSLFPKGMKSLGKAKGWNLP